MTTIIIEDGIQLSRSTFKTFEDFIDEYYESKGMIILQQIDFDTLTSVEQKSIEDSKKKGTDDLYDFQG